LSFVSQPAYPPANYGGIVSIQLRNHPAIIPLLMQGLLNYLSKHCDVKHYQGKLFTGV
jgi:hypothetical protein